MSVIEIYGENRFPEHTKVREACRGIVIKNGNILLSYEVKSDQYFIPGGGVESSESLEECAVREISEETGFLTKCADGFLTINEYYEEWLFISHYFVCDIIGETVRKLTKREAEAGLTPVFIPFKDALKVFSKHGDYAPTDEMKRGAYLREYKALLKFEELYGEIK